MIELLTPVGRVVGGHPMESYPVTDTKTGAPKMNSMNEPRTSISVGLAIPKGAETDWKQTEWGQKIQQVAVTDWPNGEHAAPAFAWKIVDGDSAIPNKKGNKPCDREGQPGHWIIWSGTEFDSIPCFNAGHYEKHEVIQRKEAIKCGDYARMLLAVKGNNPSESPGIYINPVLFELTRAGIEIVSANAPDAAAAFGGVAPQLPAGAQVDASVVPPEQVQTGSAVIAPPQQNTGFVENAGQVIAPPPEVAPHVMTAAAKGMSYENAIKAGWTDETLIANGMMQA